MTYPLTVKQLLVAAVDRFADRKALVHDDRSYTYADLAEKGNRLGHALMDLGVEPGDPVAILLENGADYVVADQAIARIGAARVALTDMLSAKDIAYCLSDSQATVAIAGGAMLTAASQSGSPWLRTILAVGDSGTGNGESTDESSAGESVAGKPAIVPLSDVVADQPATLPASSPSETDLGLIIYTGGTTGKSKGVMHHQAGLALNLLSHLIETGISEDERVLLTSPLPHSAGFLLQTAFLRGATVFLDQKYDPDAVLRRITDDRVTFTFMVPTMIYRLLDAIADRDVGDRDVADRDVADGDGGLDEPIDLSALRTILYGAAPITGDRLQQGLDMFGPVFVQLYGQSEAPNFLTRLRREDHTIDPRYRHRLSSCGQAATMVRIKIVDADDPSVELEPGEVGEVIASSPYTMSGYHNLGEATADALRDGWLHTGDIGRIDTDGYLYLLDRKNDMIISGGMNVYTTEVEDVIAAIDGVNQVAVTGVPHPDWGEAVVAFVVAEDVADNDSLVERVMGTCRTDLAKYKVPKEILLTDDLPTTAFGKVDKKALRASMAD